MKFIPLNDNVIIQRKTPVTTTVGGIILQSSQEPDRGIVIATGSDQVKVGDELLLDWSKAYKIDKENYRIHIDSIVAVFEE